MYKYHHIYGQISYWVKIWIIVAPWYHKINYNLNSSYNRLFPIVLGLVKDSHFQRLFSGGRSWLDDNASLELVIGGSKGENIYLLPRGKSISGLWCSKRRIPNSRSRMGAGLCQATWIDVPLNSISCDIWSQQDTLDRKNMAQTYVTLHPLSWGKWPGQHQSYPGWYPWQCFNYIVIPESV
jgi:hypothetical protein